MWRNSAVFCIHVTAHNTRRLYLELRSQVGVYNEKGCVLYDVRTEVDAVLVNILKQLQRLSMRTKHDRDKWDASCVILDCGDNLDVLLHEQTITVQLYIIFRCLKTVTASFYSCICARCFSLKTEKFWHKAHTNTLVVSRFDVLTGSLLRGGVVCDTTLCPLVSWSRRFEGK
jgi:hypothetical protein